MTTACHTRSTYRRLATAFHETEVDLDEGLRRIHQLVAAAATATGALSFGTRDRMENKHGYLQKTLKILEMIQNEDVGGGRWEGACKSWSWEDCPCGGSRGRQLKKDERRRWMWS